MAETSSSVPAFKLTSIPPALPNLQVKNAASHFVRSDAQTVFARRKPQVEVDAQRLKQRKEAAETLRAAAASADVDMQPQASSSKPQHPPTAAQELESAPTEAGSRTIVVQLGSTNLRIGLASHAAPVLVPFVIARPRSDAASLPSKHSDLVDPALDSKIDTMRVELRSRMRAYKLRGTTGGQQLAREFNEGVKPELIPEADDPSSSQWVHPKAHAAPFFVGQEALNIPDPTAEGYALQWPFTRGNFNSAAPCYQRKEQLLADVEDILTTVLQNKFGIAPTSLSNYNVALLVPDHSDYTLLRALSDLIMQVMGFKGILIQNEGVAASLGAGLSGACVVDLGASCIKISCLEDGWLMPDTRMVLHFGGDDHTMFMLEEFKRAAFPYREVSLANMHDWRVIEHLKEQVAALGEADVSMSTQYFDIRRPGRQTSKYALKLYDEPLLSSMLLFAPRVVDFDRKALKMPNLWPSKEAVDEAIDWNTEPSLAMKNSTSLLSAAPAPSAPLGTSPIPEAQPARSASAQPQDASSAPTAQDHVDQAWEAGKLPLDLAIVESMVAAGSEERVKKLAGAIVLTGGLANVHNIAWGISTRVTALLQQRYPTMPVGTVNIVSAPPDLDPSNLAWKGVSVLSRIDVGNEIWVRDDEYEKLGFRAVKERAVLPI